MSHSQASGRIVSLKPTLPSLSKPSSYHLWHLLSSNLPLPASLNLQLLLPASPLQPHLLPPGLSSLWTHPLSSSPSWEKCLLTGGVAGWDSMALKGEEMCVCGGVYFLLVRSGQVTSDPVGSRILDRLSRRGRGWRSCHACLLLIDLQKQPEDGSVRFLDVCVCVCVRGSEACLCVCGKSPEVNKVNQYSPSPLPGVTNNWSQ